MNMLEFLRDLRWFPYADAAWLLVLPETAGAEAVFSLHRLLRRARAEGELDGILDLVPAMRTLGSRMRFRHKGVAGASPSAMAMPGRNSARIWRRSPGAWV